MEKHEFQVLTTCVEWPFPLYNILGDIGSGMHISTAVALFYRLFASGDLFVKRCSNTDFRGYGRTAIRDLTGDAVGIDLNIPFVRQIETAIMTNDPALVFGMTEQGAGRWETFAKPDWSRYIDVSESSLDENGECETNLRASTRQRLELAIQSEFVGRPVPGSDEWHTLSPWHATYWKTVQEGCHVKLRTRVDWSVYEGEKARRMADFFSWFSPEGYSAIR